MKPAARVAQQAGQLVSESTSRVLKGIAALPPPGPVSRSISNSLDDCGISWVLAS